MIIAINNGMSREKQWVLKGYHNSTSAPIEKFSIKELKILTGFVDWTLGLTSSW